MSTVTAAICRITVTSPLSVLRLCFAEARPCVLVIFLLRFLTGAAMAGGRADLVAAAFVWEAAVFFVYLYNGVTDVREDRLNGSARPIAGGLLPQRTAAWIAVSAAVAAMVGGLLLGGPMAAAVPIMILLGLAYSGPPCYLKRRSGGAMATVTVAGLLTYYMGEAGAVPTPRLLVIALVMSLWMGLVGATTKDLPDAAGDAAAGRHTIAVTRGDRRVRWLASVSAASLGAAFLAAAVLVAPELVWPAVIMLAGAAAVAVLALSDLSQGDRSRRRRPYRAFMITQYGVHLMAIFVSVV
ncbi:UbiA family prenyltransferase [Nonomuraea sp. NPDC048916]|uniref:UbiA family prenyltransferase n=1 Tax=Nonomuraea sp. NPDC048916 TaxID=3154232 RepID=UPI0034092AA8